MEERKEAKEEDFGGFALNLVKFSYSFKLLKH